jgi:ABC-type branched-subunit amino acid transport system substrate-binding protein
LWKGEEYKMKKYVLGIAFALLLIGTMLVAVPIKAFDGQIKIGIIGPVGLPHWSPAGMKEGAELARDEINTAGGVSLPGGDYEIVLVFGDEKAYPAPDPSGAAAEVERLITVEGCEYIIGGFRTEVTTAMIEKAADYGVPFIINGASTDELIGDTVGTDYARYKYTYRINPVNSTTLFYTIAGSIAYYLIPYKLLPLYGHDLDGNPGTPDQVRVAVIAEDLEWTQTMYYSLTNPLVYPFVLGPNVDVTYSARVPDGTTNFVPYMTSLIASQARLVIHIFSGVSGVPFISTWKAMNVSALPVGINVLGQLQTHWTTTSGACEYETILDFSGTRTPIIPGKTEVFWDSFVTYTGGVWPIYPAWGAYDAIYSLKEAFEATGSTNKDTILAHYEDPSYQRQGLAGIFKFTSLHDVLSNEPGPTWTQGLVRALLVQWGRGGLKEVVSPVDQVYSKKWAIPPWMYPLIEDITYDGKVDILDIALAAKAFGTIPGDPRWEKEADITFDDKVDILDIATIAKKFGTVISLPLD